jgi:hypothetical protein
MYLEDRCYGLNKDKLLPYQCEDFKGLPAIISLLDPPAA